jgi:hypothetical protein
MAMFVKKDEKGLSIRGGTATFTHLKWSLLHPDFKEYCIRYS